MNILVTGAGQGLGACLAKALVAQGHTVFALVRPGHGLGALAAIAQAPNLTVLTADLCRPEEMAAARAAVGAAVTRLDAIANVAGVLLNKGGLLTEDRYADLETTFRVNTLAPIYLNNLFLDLMQRSTQATFLTVCSEIRTLDDVGDWFPAYCISKAATTSYCFALRATLQRQNIAARVFAVHPGRMRTAMGGDNGEIDPEESAQGLLRILTGEIQPDNTEVYIDYHGQPMLPGRGGCDALR
ncbi:MAG: SDR family NAD(P)-dependent oxidoreductase [Gemmiger sp.]|nr:SDR family NAD(P)-dependent oxidoreductase [Gemmiger sp.]